MHLQGSQSKKKSRDFDEEIMKKIESKKSEKNIFSEEPAEEEEIVEDKILEENLNGS